MSSMFKIFVGNIGFDTTEQKLRKIFEPHIEIEDLVVASDPETGKSKGYAFVMTRDHIRGRRAVAQVGKFFIDGRLAYAKESHSKKSRAQMRRDKMRGARRVSHRPRPMRRGNFTARGGGGSQGGKAGDRSVNANGNTHANGDGRTDASAATGQSVSRGYVGLNEEAGAASQSRDAGADSTSPRPR